MIQDKDMIGKTFGDWTVINRGKNLYNRAAYICKCKCGIEKLVNGNELRRNKTTMCMKCSKLKKHNYKNKHYGEYTEYIIYQGMLARGTDISNNNYFGRGISVCQRWQKSFVNFMDDMGERPSLKHSIDRIDNNGIYSKENCRWTTIDVQNNNRRPKLSKYYSFHKRKNLYIVSILGKFVGYYKTEEEAILNRDKYILDNKLELRTKNGN
jgi:hypothetical protein